MGAARWGVGKGGKMGWVGLECGGCLALSVAQQVRNSSARVCHCVVDPPCGTRALGMPLLTNQAQPT